MNRVKRVLILLVIPLCTTNAYANSVDNECEAFFNEMESIVEQLIQQPKANVVQLNELKLQLARDRQQTVSVLKEKNRIECRDSLNALSNIKDVLGVK